MTACTAYKCFARETFGAYAPRAVPTPSFTILYNTPAEAFRDRK